MTDIQNLRNHLEQQKGMCLQLERIITETQSSVKQLRRELHRHEQAREIIRHVGLKTQQQLQFHISGIVSLALEAVFDDPYELKVEFVQRRNKTECDLLFDREGNQIDPLSASGGGVVDVAAFALRAASWSMQRPRSRPVLVLDEPLKFVSEKYQIQASEMLKEISVKLGLQIIMITHSEELIGSADKVFVVKMKGGVSYVKS